MVAISQLSVSCSRENADQPIDLGGACPIFRQAHMGHADISWFHWFVIGISFQVNHYIPQEKKVQIKTDQHVWVHGS